MIETPFCRWKSTDNNDINVFLSVENPCTFLLAKEKTWKRIFNINSGLSQNRTEKQIMLFKTTVNCLFNDIWCYLIIGCFDWKISVVQQTVVWGFILKVDRSATKFKGDFPHIEKISKLVPQNESLLAFSGKVMCSKQKSYNKLDSMGFLSSHWWRC